MSNDIHVATERAIHNLIAAGFFIGVGTKYEPKGIHANVRDECMTHPLYVAAQRCVMARLARDGIRHLHDADAVSHADEDLYRMLIPAHEKSCELPHPPKEKTARALDSAAAEKLKEISGRHLRAKPPLPGERYGNGSHGHGQGH